MNINKVMKRISSVLCILAVLFILFFAATMYKIYSSVRATCIKAKLEYEGDCVEALMSVVRSERHSSRDKNRAIWALGQIVDKRALPLMIELKKTVSPLKPCRRSEHICIHEVEKAFKWCTQGNITSWMYKNREGWS